MSLLKVVPIALAMVTVGAIALGAISNSNKDTETDIDTANGFEETKQAVLDRMKQCQNELARLSDLKVMNDKREATNMVSNIELSIDGIEITTVISDIEDELTRLTNLYNSIK